MLGFEIDLIGREYILKENEPIMWDSPTEWKKLKDWTYGEILLSWIIVIDFTVMGALFILVILFEFLFINKYVKNALIKIGSILSKKLITEDNKSN